MAPSFYASPLLSSRPYPQYRHPHHHPSTPTLPPPPPRQKKRKLISESEVYEKQLQASLGDLDRAKRQYEKTFKQSVVAAENWQKADADLNLSRFVNHKRQAGATSRLVILEIPRTRARKGGKGEIRTVFERS